MKQTQITRHRNRKPSSRRSREPESVSAQLSAERVLDKWYAKWRVGS